METGSYDIAKIKQKKEQEQEQEQELPSLKVSPIAQKEALRRRKQDHLSLSVENDGRVNFGLSGTVSAQMWAKAKPYLFGGALAWLSVDALQRRISNDPVNVSIEKRVETIEGSLTSINRTLVTILERLNK